MRILQVIVAIIIPFILLSEESLPVNLSNTEIEKYRRELTTKEKVEAFLTLLFESYHQPDFEEAWTIKREIIPDDSVLREACRDIFHLQKERLDSPSKNLTDFEMQDCRIKCISSVLWLSYCANQEDRSLLKNLAMTPEPGMEFLCAAARIAYLNAAGSDEAQHFLDTVLSQEKKEDGYVRNLIYREAMVVYRLSDSEKKESIRRAVRRAVERETVPWVFKIGDEGLAQIDECYSNSVHRIELRRNCVSKQNTEETAGGPKNGKADLHAHDSRLIRLFAMLVIFTFICSIVCGIIIRKSGRCRRGSGRTSHRSWRR